nr:hypothetical protein [Tanacetum cinerariifolium]
MHLVTRNILSAKIRGGLDAEKALVESWIMEYDARQENPIYGLAGRVYETRNRIKLLQEKIEMYKKRYGHVSRLSKCTTSLD